MMETFIVLGLCFILYEALDFFQGCMHSTAPSATDQIDAYRRQLDEQRQQQTTELFLANFSPLLNGLQLTSSTTTTPTQTPTASTASVISDLRAQSGYERDTSLAASTPALHTSAFRPAHRSVYESQELHATSSLPRDYYYIQQQQLKNKNSTKSLLSKFSANSSDNRIFPETTTNVLGVPAGVITTQPTFASTPTAAAAASSFDCQPPVVPPSPLLLDLKRAILHNNNNINNYNSKQLVLGGDNLYNVPKQFADPQQQQQQPPVRPPRRRQRQRQQLAQLQRIQIQTIATHTSSSLHSDESDCDDNHSISSHNSNCSSYSGTSSASAASESLSAASHILASDEEDVSRRCCENNDDDDCNVEDNDAEGAADERACLSQQHLNSHHLHNHLHNQHHHHLSHSHIGSSLSSSHADVREIECERLRRKCVSVKRIYSISEKF